MWQPSNLSPWTSCLGKLETKDIISMQEAFVWGKARGYFFTFSDSKSARWFFRVFFLTHFPLFSPRLLFEDNDSGLFSVTLFRKAIDDFKHQARENK